jgi:hypothetical protein
MEERPGSAWFGLPAMFAYVIAAAVLFEATSLKTLIIAAAGVFLIFLAIGLAMTIAKRN